MGSLLPAMLNDYKLTGKCNVALSNENYAELRTSWALRKASPFTATFNKG